jgi:hypothetical protein
MPQGVAALASVDDIDAARLAPVLDDAFALVAVRFFRREVRARACVAGMLSGLERKTSSACPYGRRYARGRSARSAGSPALRRISTN